MVSLPDRLGTAAAITFAVLLLVPTGVTAVAGTHADGSTVADTNGSAANAENPVAFVRTIEEMKGHLTVSVEYARANNTEQAAHHAHHPYEEYWTAINATLSDVNVTLANNLERALLAAPDHARNDSASAYATWVTDTLFGILNDAKHAVAGEKTTNATFNAKVSRDLLQRAVQEYREGVAANGTIVNQMEYDDAHGFAVRADALYQSYVRETLSEHAREELDELFENLHAAVNDSASPTKLVSITNGIAAEYSEYTGIEAETGGTQVEQVVTEIEEHLHAAVEAYANGNSSEAKQIIRQTYLSYFEGLEGELIEKRPELVEELEAAFNNELPSLIEQGAPVSELRNAVESMEEDLQTVETVLSDKTETTISLGNETTTTTASTTDATSTTASGSTPGFGVGVALTAILSVALLAVRRSN